MTIDDLPFHISPAGCHEEESFELHTLSPENLRQGRQICERCHKPSPKACLCSALPLSPVIFSKCCVLALVHPLELRRKNRSLPLIELCVGDVYPPQIQNDEHWFPPFSFCTQVGRNKFQITMDPVIQHLLHHPNMDILLLFPSPNAIRLQEALDLVQERRHKRKANKELHSDDPRIILIFLDATWKEAKEMEKACTFHHVWPDHAIRVRLDPQDFVGSGYQPKRFHSIRTPPSESHFSTAESIAMVVSRIENNHELYDTFMKPLDLMVEQSHG